VSDEEPKHGRSLAGFVAVLSGVNDNAPMPSYPVLRQGKFAWWNPLGWVYLAILLAWLPIALILFLGFHALLLLAFVFFWVMNKALAWYESKQGTNADGGPD
jgi:hypothetical protein